MEKLSPSEIFSGTSIFSWIKMGLSAAIAAVSIIVFAIVNAVCSHGDGSFNIIGLIIWLALTCVIAIGVKTAVACKFRAAHVAVVVDAVNMGVIPEGQVSAGIETVTSRFGSASGYAAVEKGVQGSVMKIQKTLNVYGERMLGVPVVSQLIKLSQNFVGWALSFMSDCCMGYTFNDEQGISQCNRCSYCLSPIMEKPVSKRSKTCLNYDGLPCYCLFAGILYFSTCLFKRSRQCCIRTGGGGSYHIYPCKGI